MLKYFKNKSNLLKIKLARLITILDTSLFDNLKKKKKYNSAVDFNVCKVKLEKLKVAASEWLSHRLQSPFSH